MILQPAPKKFLLMAGGTGGHVFPALALARQLRADGFVVEWIGSEGGFEGPYVEAENIPLHNISIKGLRGKGIVSWLSAPLKLVRAVKQARKIVKQVEPDCVVGMGGFAAGPGGIAAWLSRKPLLIHEQNAAAGMTNRALFYLSSRVLQAFPDAFGKQHKKLRTTGNPVRKELTEIAAYEKRKADVALGQPINLLVLGGSQGAAAINQTIPAAIAEMKCTNKPNIWHQAGKGKSQPTSERYKEMGVEVKIEEFIEDMAEAYGWADLVVCRSGALTVAELAAVGVGSILVPYPSAVDDHQTKNADYLASVGAALIVQQQDLNKESLGELIDQFCTEPQQLIEMANKARSVAKPDAVHQVENYCLELVQ
ncbi:MAG: undecaprenyldiphospho-muramoylpentapeptide beta-N-acetylglucosaminyltransferase [Pseudomonadales bacterium]|nr:undecaprenyldiphospho-muramoylpentapeptide beta-N-acetylglucosaminyltransferase [Pseudomonadales bacterium]